MTLNDYQAVAFILGPILLALAVTAATTAAADHFRNHHG